MKIGMILEHHFPPDDRVYKEAVSLIESGHQVYLLCSRFSDEPLVQSIDEIEINRLKLTTQTTKIFRAFIFVFPLFSIFWRLKINSFVRRNKIEVLHIHDLPLCGPALSIAKKHSIKLVCDMHEDYANWVMRTPFYTNGKLKFLRYFDDWKKYEKKCLTKADFVVGVSQPLVDAMILNYGLIEKKVINIPNTPNLAIFQRPCTDDKLIEEMKPYFNLIYSGAIDQLRGLQFVIPLLSELSILVPNIRLVILGEGRYVEDLKLLVKQKNVDKFTYFAGFMPIQTMADYIGLSHIGIYPQKRYPGVDETVPTKLFQYLSKGIPVISSNHKLPTEIINQFSCGYVVDFENNPDTFIQLVKMLYDNPKLRITLGENGQKGVEEYFNWNKTVQPLIRLYSNLKK